MVAPWGRARIPIAGVSPTFTKTRHLLMACFGFQKRTICLEGTIARNLDCKRFHSNRCPHHQAHESNHQPLLFLRPSLAQPEKLLSGAARCHWQLGLSTIPRTKNKCRAPGMATTEASRSPHQIANRNQRQNKEMADKGAASSSQTVFWSLEPLRQAATITLQ